MFINLSRICKLIYYNTTTQQCDRNHVRTSTATKHDNHNNNEKKKNCNTKKVWYMILLLLILFIVAISSCISIIQIYFIQRNNIININNNNNNINKNNIETTSTTASIPIATETSTTIIATGIENVAIYGQHNNEENINYDSNIRNSKNNNNNNNGNKGIESSLVSISSSSSSSSPFLTNNTTYENDNKNFVNNNDELKRILYSLKLLAYRDADFPINTTTTDIDNNDIYIPTSGYRNCLKSFFPSIHKKPSIHIAYMGDWNINNEIINRNKNGLDDNNNDHNDYYYKYYNIFHRNHCKNCIYIGNVSSIQQSFHKVSDMICKSRILYCLVGSSYLCGLIGISLRTPIIVDYNEYIKWPKNVIHDNNNISITIIQFTNTNTTNTSIINSSNNVNNSISSRIQRYATITTSNTRRNNLLTASTSAIVNTFQWNDDLIIPDKLIGVNSSISNNSISSNNTNNNNNTILLVDDMIYTILKYHQNDTIIRINHRIIFDIYTIKTTHPILMKQQFKNIYNNDIGYNVMIYSDRGLCYNVSRNIPIQHGNMGDIFGTYFAYYMARQLNKTMHVRCATDAKDNYKPPPKNNHITFGFIGSFVGPVLKNYVSPHGTSSIAYNYKAAKNHNNKINKTRTKYPPFRFVPKVKQPISKSGGTSRSLIGFTTKKSSLSSSTRSSNTSPTININVILGMGVYDDKASRITISKSRNGRVLGVRGPLTRDAFLAKQGINPEIISDPGLFFPIIFEKEIQSSLSFVQQQSTIESNSSTIIMMKELCFISHEAENQWYMEHLIQYENITLRAGKLGDGGDIYDVIPFIATCKRVISSSLHGIVFAHSLSIPSLAIQVTNKLAGGNFKFIDYYHSVGVTSFMKRHHVNVSDLPSNQDDWIRLVNDAPQPLFPIEFNISCMYKIMETIYYGTQ